MNMDDLLLLAKNYMEAKKKDIELYGRISSTTIVIVGFVLLYFLIFNDVTQATGRIIPIFGFLVIVTLFLLSAVLNFAKRKILDQKYQLITTQIENILPGFKYFLDLYENTPLSKDYRNYEESISLTDDTRLKQFLSSINSQDTKPSRMIALKIFDLK
jgi:hypothetical protein